MHATPWEHCCVWNGCLWKVSNSNYYSGAKVSHEALISEWLFFFFHLPSPSIHTDTHKQTHTYEVLSWRRHCGERCFRDLQTPDSFVCTRLRVSFNWGGDLKQTESLGVGEASGVWK